MADLTPERLRAIDRAKSTMSRGYGAIFMALADAYELQEMQLVRHGDTDPNGRVPFQLRFVANLPEESK